MKRKPQNNLWLRSTSLVMSAVFFYVQIAYSALEPASKLWQERKKAAEKIYQSDEDKIPNLPAKVAPPKEEDAILSQLPALDLNILKNAVPKIEEFAPSGHDYLTVPAGTLKKKPSKVAFAKALPDWFKSVPISYSNLIDFYVPDDWKANDLMIVHIQDAHENFEAQSNIAKIIDSLTKENTAQFTKSPVPSSQRNLQVVVGLEGASGDMNFEPYRFFPDQEISKQVALHLLNESLISGAEYVGMTSNSHALFWGVEDKKLYLEHIRAFKDSIPLEKEAKLTVSRYKSHLNNLKDKSFNPELKELDQKIVQFHSGKLNLSDYIKTLTKDGIPPTMEMVKLFINALFLEESLDYEKIESERRKLTQALTEKLSKSELDNLLKASLSHRMGGITYGTFYQYLTDLCKAYRISLFQWPEMDKYIRYVLMSDKIRAEDLFQEIGELEHRKIDRAISNKKEEELVELSQDLMLVEKLVEFKLSPKEWKLYQARKEEIGKIAKRLGIADEPTFLKRFERFNEAAIARDHALISNLLKKVNYSSSSSNQPPYAVLVTGGFHTDGMTQILRDKKIAYTVFAPKLGKVDESGADYLGVFRRDKTPLEKLFTGERITLKSPLPTALNPATDELTPATYVVERKFSLFAAALLTKKILSQVTNLSKDQRKEIRKTISTWIASKSNQFQTIQSVTIDAIKEYRDKEGNLERIVIQATLHGKEGQNDSVVAIEVLPKDSQAEKGVEDAKQLRGDKATSKVGEDTLIIYVPNPSILIELSDVLNHKLPDLSNWVLEKIRNRSLALAKNVKDKVSGAIVGSNEIIDSRKKGEDRHLEALGNTTSKQFRHRWFIRLDGDMLGNLNLFYGKKILGTMFSENSLFRESQEILKRVVLKEGGNLYMGEGADEIILEFEGDYDTIKRKLNNVVAKYTIAFRDRYAVVRIEANKLTPDQEKQLKTLRRVLVVEEHGNGFNLLIDREGLGEIQSLVQEIQKIMPHHEIADITHTKTNESIGFLTMTGGAISYESVIEYMATMIQIDDYRSGRKALSLRKIKNQLHKKFRSKDEDFLKLFYFIGLQLSDIAVGVAKYEGRNQGFIPEGLEDLTKRVNAMSKAKSGEKKEQQQVLEGPEVTREMIENPAAALDRMNAAAKEDGKDGLTGAHTIDKLKELAIEGEHKTFGFFRILSFFKSRGRERAFHMLQEKVQHKGGDQTIITIADTLDKNKVEIFFNGERVIIARQGAEKFVIAYDTKVRGPPTLKKLVEEITLELKKIHPDMDLEIVFYEVSMEEMEALKGREEFKEYQNQYKLLGMMEQIVDSMATVGVDQLRDTGLIVEQDGPIYVVRFDHRNFDQLMQSYRDAQDRLSKRAMKDMEDARAKMPSPMIMRDEKTSEKRTSFVDMWKKLVGVFKEEEGLSTVEYGTILAVLNPIGLFIGGVSLVVWGSVNLVKMLTGTKSLPESVLLNDLLEQLPNDAKNLIEKDLSKGLLPKPEKILNKLKPESTTERDQLEQIIHTIHIVQMARVFSITKGGSIKGGKLISKDNVRLARFMDSKELAQIELSEIISAYENLYQQLKAGTKKSETIKEHFGYLASVLFESGGANDLGIGFDERWKAYKGLKRLFDSNPIISEFMKDAALAMWENGKRKKEAGNYRSRLVRTRDLGGLIPSEAGSVGVELFNIDDLSFDGLKLLVDRVNQIPEGKQLYLFTSKDQVSSSDVEALKKQLLAQGVSIDRLTKIHFGGKGQVIYGTTELGEIVRRIKVLTKDDKPNIAIFTERNVFKGKIEGLKIQIFVILSETHLVEISQELELFNKASVVLALQQ